MGFSHRRSALRLLYKALHGLLRIQSSGTDGALRLREAANHRTFPSYAPHPSQNLLLYSVQA